MNVPPPFNPPTTNATPGALVRAMCGPLLLTTLGTLLAIDYAGQMSFSRTWPALLIVFGLCKLAEKARV
jgi:hypothetical protein